MTLPRAALPVAWQDGSVAAASESKDGKGLSGAAVPFKQDYAATREMVIRAGRYVRRARDLGFTLDFSDTSIEAAELFGLELWAMLPGGLSDAQAHDLRARLIFELGAYFGETFIRNHGGRWGWAVLLGRRVFALQTSSGVTAFPPRTARKRLQGEESETLATLYEFLSRSHPKSHPKTKR